MLQEASNLCSNISVLRRLTFAATAIPKDTPRYWELVTEFGFQECSISSHLSDKVRILLENTTYLEEHAFDKDNELFKELAQMKAFQKHQLGIVLISSNSTCINCGGNLLVRSDRPSFPYLYSDDLGTITCTHFRKYCQNASKGCSFTQHYGFHMDGDDSVFVYDRNCLELPYFVSSHMTVFQMSLLCKFKAEILIGQLSYRQRCEIYNYSHDYDFTSTENDPSR